MSLINWGPILSPDVTVAHSNLALPEERDEADRDVAAFRTSSGYIIDVEWNDDEERYVVSVFKDTYENDIDTIKCRDVSDVISTVAELCSSYSQDVIGARTTGTTADTVGV